MIEKIEKKAAVSNTLNNVDLNNVDLNSAALIEEEKLIEEEMKKRADKIEIEELLK